MNESEFNRLLLSVKTSERALTKLHGYYFGRIVFHVAKTYGKPFAEDVAEDFFLWLLKAEHLPHVLYPTAWVYLQCDSIAKRKVQKEARYVHGEIEFEQEEKHKEELFGDLYEAIGGLGEIEKKIVEMHYWEGYSLKEIAPILGIEYAAVRQRHKRLLSKLKETLKKIGI
ncbi:MAG: sigma-70 family RNA polymerase sigma factor [Clostridia bacterium]|nr:sigma-70 family RNA polymerase sigma factor [Clostridia bacterium]